MSVFRDLPGTQQPLLSCTMQLWRTQMLCQRCRTPNKTWQLPWPGSHRCVHLPHVTSPSSIRVTAAALICRRAHGVKRLIDGCCSTDACQVLPADKPRTGGRTSAKQLVPGLAAETAAILSECRSEYSIAAWNLLRRQDEVLCSLRLESV